MILRVAVRMLMKSLTAMKLKRIICECSKQQNSCIFQTTPQSPLKSFASAWKVVIKCCILVLEFGLRTGAASWSFSCSEYEAGIFRATYCLGIKVVLSICLLNVWVPSAKWSPRVGSWPPPQTIMWIKYLNMTRGLQTENRAGENGERRSVASLLLLSGLIIIYPL